jgi:hypothetical protein
MRRRSILLFAFLIPAAIYGCGPQPQPQPESGVSSDVCPTISEGPPPVCPEGCKWVGNQCKKYQGIIMEDARDGGAGGSGSQ